MHTSGLVITVVDDSVKAQAAWDELASAGPFTLGEANGPCRAAVLEATDALSAQEWHDRAAQVPGIVSIEVVFVHWEAAEGEVAHAGG